MVRPNVVAAAGIAPSRARSDIEEARLRRLLATFDWLPFDPVADFNGASIIYRACRRAGVTPRGLIDCAIASVALRNDAFVLTHDRDFALMATAAPLRLDTRPSATDE